MNTSSASPAQNEQTTSAPSPSPSLDTDPLIPVRTPTGRSVFMGGQSYVDWLQKNTEVKPSPADGQSS